MKLAWDSKRTKDRQDGKYTRQRSDDPYHTARWTKLSRAFRADPAHCLCEECKRRGIIKEAKVVDHRIPWPVCEDFFDESNLQGLCEECNNLKGQRDKSIIQKWKREHSR